MGEVAGDVAPYSSSGWCFSELSIGLLGNQLDTYSADSEPVRQLVRPESLCEKELQKFIDASNAELASKVFFNEDDRMIVRGIIKNFLYKSRLVSAIEAKDAGALTAILQDVQHHGLYDFLEQPVDASLNTPLHLAVAMGFTEGVTQLLQRGARRSCINLYGDMPMQCRMLPRLSAAAMACRFYRQGKDDSGPAQGSGQAAKPTSHFFED